MAKIEDEHVKIWSSRRTMIRGALYTARAAAAVRGKFGGDGSPDSTGAAAKNAVLLTAFAVAAGAATIRIGGRAALLSVLGLDFMADSGIKGSLDGGLDFVQNAGVYKYLLFAAGWLASKTLCADFLSVILALISGILFGGVVEGAAASVVCATLASVVGFQLARTQLRDRVIEQVEKRPALRAVERAVSKGGFKTVLTLRLAPLLPIPLGAYNYVYGVTSLSLGEFTAGTFLGSIKPYLLDSYLGVFGKSLVDGGGGGGGGNDAVLLGTFAVAVLIGTLASELAGRTWDELSAEASSSGGGDGDAAAAPLRWNEMMGIARDELPPPVRQWDDKTSAAEGLIWGVVQEEWERLQRNRSGGEEEEEEPPPPCPPPLTAAGGVDMGVYIAESWAFNGALFRALGEYSDPAKAPEPQ
ncbi:hypothetical UPF0043 protein [Tribonema minus]|uniref:Hypothetical UPF0043 protein n=1 Tax=Tribonema minus TaxID=303371 RepID=A0A836CC84_9STRA|nr:hypothetical UPF0043 protein [Tribonema minus]